MRPVIIGSGVAGLAAALAMAPTPCLLLTEGTLAGNSASMLAQGGLAAAVGDGDDPAQHAADTMRAGAFVNDAATVRRITELAPVVARRLDKLGVPFNRDGDRFDLGLEGGHRRHRIVHAGDRSGAAITSTLVRAVQESANIEVHEGISAISLTTNSSGAIAGVVVRNAEGATHEIATDRVILATGGLGGLFAHTTNPLTAVGQGVALAARVGARTDDLHLVQFHPTGLAVDLDPMPLLTEALRGAGAVLRSDGTRFIDELQPRDVVAAAVWEQLQDGHKVTLDARSIPNVASRFPAVAELTAAAGLCLRTDLLPVRPTVHYSMGGVTVDARSRTTVPGLWAVGEVARTGLHGANRLASNSLLEAFVTGEAAGTDARSAPESWSGTTAFADPELRRSVTSQLRTLARTEVRTILSEACGVLRDGPSLRDAVHHLEAATHQDDAYVAWLIARSALLHTESIGAHRRLDSVNSQSAERISA